MSPLERLRNALATRTAQVRLIGFDQAQQSRLVPILTSTGYQFTLDDQPASCMDINAVPATEANVLIWNTRLQTTPAQGVDSQTLFDGTQKIAEKLRLGQLLIVCGPIPPGTTRGLVLPRLTISGLRPGQDFYLAYAPRFECEQNPCVLGSLDSESHHIALSFLAPLAWPIIPVSTLETAELCGLLPLLYRTTQMALGHELRLLSDRIGASFWEAIGAVGLPELSPTGKHHDFATAFLTWGARRFDTTPRLCELAGEIHATRPAFLLAKLEETLNAHGRPLRGSRVLLFGADPSPSRDSQSGRSIIDELWNTLHKKGASVTTRDPALTDSATLSAELLAAQDIIVILASHANDKYDFIVSHGRLILDTQHATRNVTQGREKIVTV